MLIFDVHPPTEEEEDDKDIDLETDPFTNHNSVTMAELTVELGDLTLDQEINGDSRALP